MDQESTAPSDTSSASTSDQLPTAAAAAAPPAPAFTQDDVNRIVAKRLEEDRARRTAPKAPESTEKKTAITADEVTALLASQRAFDRVTAGAGLSDRQMERMEAARKAENPQDVAAWARGYLEDMGLGKSNVNPSPNAQTAPVAEHKPAAVAPSSSQPSAVTPVTTGGLVDIYNLTPEQFASMTPAQMREHHERNVAAGNARTGAPRLPMAVQKR
jgi:predicted Zn-dependent peptidase